VETIKAPVSLCGALLHSLDRSDCLTARHAVLSSSVAHTNQYDEWLEYPTNRPLITDPSNRVLHFGEFLDAAVKSADTLRLLLLPRDNA